MKRILIYGISFMIFGLLFTGCSRVSSSVLLPKNEQFCKEKLKSQDVQVCEIVSKNDTIVISGKSNLSSYGFRHADYNNSTSATIQAAADSTILRNHKYFAIVSPQKLSNENGVLMNTPEEFFKKCNTDLVDIFTFQWGKCDIHRESRFTGNMTIQIYKDRPVNVLVYDANEVISYLKKEDRYDDEGKIKNITIIDKKKN